MHKFFVFWAIYEKFGNFLTEYHNLSMLELCISEIVDLNLDSDISYTKPVFCSFAQSSWYPVIDHDCGFMSFVIHEQIIFLAVS
jgi:hypothetical protein